MDSPAKHTGPSQPPDDGQMTCRELVELVTAYRDGVLSARDRDRFDAHLSVCPPCVTYVEQIDATVRTLGTLGDLDEQVAMVEQQPATQELLQLFRTWKSDQ